MPYRMRSIRSGAGVEIALFGAVTGDEILEASHAVYDIVPADSQRFQIWDYTEAAGLRATTDEVRAVAQVDSSYAAQRKSPMLVAAVQPTDLGFGLGRMYGVYAEGPNWITAHFRSRGEAERWLDESL